MILTFLNGMDYLKHKNTRQSDFSPTQARLLSLDCSIYYLYVFLNSRDEGIFFLLNTIYTFNSPRKQSCWPLTN